jgi:hypothetical protein
VNMPPTFPVVFVCVNMPPTFPVVFVCVNMPPTIPIVFVCVNMPPTCPVVYYYLSLCGRIANRTASAVGVRKRHACARSLKSSLSLKIPAPPTSVQLHGAPQETRRWLRCYPNTKRLLLSCIQITLGTILQTMHSFPVTKNGPTRSKIQASTYSIIAHKCTADSWHLQTMHASLSTPYLCSTPLPKLSLSLSLSLSLPPPPLPPSLSRYQRP